MQDSRSDRHRAFSSAVAVTAAVCSLTVLAQSPAGWSKAGSHPADYDMGVDRDSAFTGSSSGFIKSNKPDPQGFGTYMQMFDATEYRGKRLRLSHLEQVAHAEGEAKRGRVRGVHLQHVRRDATVA